MHLYRANQEVHLFSICPPHDNIPVFSLCNFKKISHPFRAYMFHGCKLAPYFPKTLNNKFIFYERLELCSKPFKTTGEMLNTIINIISIFLFILSYMAMPFITRNGTIPATLKLAVSLAIRKSRTINRGQNPRIV